MSRARHRFKCGLELQIKECVSSWKTQHPSNKRPTRHTGARGEAHLGWSAAILDQASHCEPKGGLVQLVQLDARLRLGGVDDVALRCHDIQCGSAHQARCVVCGRLDIRLQ